MNWKIIKIEEEYTRAVARIIEIFQAEPDTPEDDELEILGLLIKDYEDKNHPMPELDVLEVIKMKMKEKGIKNKDLESIIGNKEQVLAVLSGEKDISLKMAQKLKNYFEIPAEVFLHRA